MANFFGGLFRGAFGQTGVKPERIKPMQEQGTSGTPVWGGYVESGEQNAQLNGYDRYRTANDILLNISTVAASVRYFLNLVAKPAWSFEPADDSDEAKRLAEFCDEIIGSTSDAWSRIIRRGATYKFHGFGVQEWLAQRRSDGLIGFSNIENRPQHTIEQWDIDQNGSVIGIIQRSPQTSQSLYLPRGKVIYVRDDTLSDSPEGIGWFRHLVEPSNRLKQYLFLEGLGFERDLAGIPVGRVPYEELNEAVKAGKITSKQRDDMIAGLEEFVRLKAKKRDTGLLLDSAVYKGQNQDGKQPTPNHKWGMELLTGGNAASVAQLDRAVDRIKREMADIIGTGTMLTGQDGTGAFSLGKDKTQALYMQVMSTLADMRDQYGRDLLNALWALNGFPEELRPYPKTEDVSYKDVEQVARVLRDISAAGAPLSPDDEAINDVRDLLGVSRHESPEEIDDGDLLPDEEEES